MTVVSSLMWNGTCTVTGTGFCSLNYLSTLHISPDHTSGKCKSNCVCASMAVCSMDHGVYITMSIVKPLNNGHIGTEHFVHYTERTTFVRKNVY